VHFGYLVTVCQRAQEECPVFPFVHQRLSWPFEDPAKAEGSEEVRLEAFRRVRDEIDERVRRWVQDELHPPTQVTSEPAS
jgi:arsenate reductase